MAEQLDFKEGNGKQQSFDYSDANSNIQAAVKDLPQWNTLEKSKSTDSFTDKAEIHKDGSVTFMGNSSEKNALPNGTTVQSQHGDGQKQIEKVSTPNGKESTYNLHKDKTTSTNSQGAEHSNWKKGMNKDESLPNKKAFDR